MSRSPFILRTAVLLATAVLVRSAHGSPQIQITNVPDYGVNGSIEGVVTGLSDYTGYTVAPYLHVEGVGWYTKPMFAQPTVPVNPDGTFVANVTTGGADPFAQIYQVYLRPPGSPAPPSANGDGPVPVDASAVASAYRTRYPDTLEFDGRNWAAKGPYTAGPGGNHFAVGPSNVWVDGAGLHLTIRNNGAVWEASEVILPQRLGYGTYAIQTTGRLDTLDPNAVLGLFTWDPFGNDPRIPSWPYREIDFEVTRWANASDPTNAQMVVQPFGPSSLRRFTLPDLSGDSRLTQILTWQPGSVEFTALVGHHTTTDYAPADVVDHWVFREDPATGDLVPDAGQAMFHINFWLCQKDALDEPVPANGQDIEVVVNHFSFTVVEPGDANGDGYVDDKDASIVGAHWLRASAAWADGDFNDDNVVDDRDAAILAAHWNPPVEDASVPEPSMFSLLSLLTIAGGFLARRLSGKQRASSSHL